MYSIPEDSIIEFQYRYTLSEQQMINVFHYKNGAAIVDGKAAADEAAQEFWDQVGLALQTRQSDAVVNIHIRAQWVYPTRYAFVTFVPPVTQGGTLNTPVTIGTCVVLKKISELAGQSHRGRAYIGGCPQQDVGIGLLTDPGFLIWDTAAQQLPVDINLPVATSIIEPMIWSYSNPTGTDEVVEATADRVLRYQRRREVGRGE